MESKALRSWTDTEERNRKLPKEYNNPAFQQTKARFDHITGDLHSWIDAPLLWKKLKEGKPKVYWGTATTGRPHLGYFVPIYKLAAFLEAGCDVTVLFADLHGFLDNLKSDWTVLAHRCAYYEFVIREMLRSVGVNVDSASQGTEVNETFGVSPGTLSFVRGSSYQLSPAFTLDVYKFSVLVTTGDTTRAGAEVVKQQAQPYMSNLLYPILQALDEQHLGCDIQFGGVDQRKIFMFSRENIARLGYVKRGYLMNPLIPGLGKSGKMSSSEPLSKVDFDDSPSTLAKKIRGAFCASPADTTDPEEQEACMCNGLLAICKFILFRWILAQQAAGRDVKFVAKDREFTSYEQVADAYRIGNGPDGLYPNELKDAVLPLLDLMLSPLRDQLTNPGEKGCELLLQAYPEVGVQRKKAKKLEAAAAKGPTSFADADVVVGLLHATGEEAAPGVFSGTVDVGGDEPLACHSPLVPSTPTAGMPVLILLNLQGKLFHATGIESAARLLCVEDAEGTRTAVLAPAGAKAGDRVMADDVDGDADDAVNPRVWHSKIASKLVVDASGAPSWDGHVLKVGDIALPTIEGAAGCSIKADDKVAPPKTKKKAGGQAGNKAQSAPKAQGKAQGKAPKGGNKAEDTSNKPVDISRLDLVVGRIVSVEKHPDADSLYIEQIDLGEESGPRQIVSGLVNYYSLEDMKRDVVVIANLKPANLKSVRSSGMVLCGANADRSVVEFVDPPAGAQPGDRIAVDGYGVSVDPSHTADLVIDIKKKTNPWTPVAVDLVANDQGVATYKGTPLTVNGQALTLASLTNCHLS